MENSPNYKKYLPLIIVALALSLRLGYLSEIAAHNPYFQQETLVAEAHQQWAIDILNGRTSPVPEPFIRAPLYPYLLALVYGIFGASTLSPRLLQLLVSAGLTYFIFRAGEKVYGYWSGIAAALIWAFYGPEIFFAGELYETSLTAALIFVVYLLWTKADESGKPLIYLLAGLFLSAAILMKPNSALLLPLLIIWHLYSKRAVGVKWKSLLLFTAGSILLVAPVTIRNAIVGKEFVPVAAYGGLNFYLGNNPQSDGVSAILPDWAETSEDEAWGNRHHATALTALSVRKAGEAAGREITPARSSRYWWNQTLKWALNKPHQFILHDLKKSLLFLSGFEFGNTRDLYFSRNYSSILSVLMWNFNGIKFPLGLLLPFAGLGLYYACARKLPGRGNLLVFLLGTALSTIIIFVCARFRMTAIPFLIILSGGGLVYAFSELTGKKVMVNLAIFIPLLIIANADFFRLQKDTAFQEYYNLGRFYSQRGEYRKALEAYANSFQRKPNFMPTLSELGLLYEAMGQYQQSARFQRAVVQADSNNAVALYNLGAVEGKAGNMEAAEKYLKKAVELDETLWQAWLNLGNVYAYNGEYDEAEKCFHEVLNYTPDNPDLLFNLGNLQILKGDTLSALQYFRTVKEMVPEYPSLDDIIGKIKNKYGLKDD